jgi:hypothetical protein
LSLVVFGSRLPDPIGRIWYALCLVVLADLLWWQELCLGRMMELGISRNKAVFPIFWRLVELVLLRGARRSPVTLNVRFPRWKLGAVCRSSEAFFNKRIGGLLCCWSSLLLLSILAGRGGEENGWLAAALCSDGGGLGVRDTVTAWSSSSVARAWLPTLDAGGQQLHGLAPVLRQVFFNLPWRPCVGLATELSLSTSPSGLVPGAGGDDRRLKPKIVGGDGGPDCFFYFLFRVCSVKAKGLIRFVLFTDVLYVICTTPLLV